MNGQVSPFTPPSHADITAAAERLAATAVCTPLLENAALNDAVGGRILLKAETLQRTGSFKFRGAYNFISQLDGGQRRRGVVAYSSGNHAQGVAAAAALLGAPATIVMPTDAPSIKLDNTRALGATVVTYDRHSEPREEIAAQLATESGATLVPPYDHPWTIAGQGTVGLEIAAQAAMIGAMPDALVVCCGGGGLTAGIATVFAEAAPTTGIYTAEPRDFDDTAQSLATGRLVTNQPGGNSICDALLAPTPGALTFSINNRLVTGGVSVSDDDVRRAMLFAWQSLKLVVEPGGAVALAAVLSGAVDCGDRVIAVVLSGANIDAAVFREVLKDAEGR
ncbi:MAG: threonine/serine dehydratase [Alphaproteobacteria bacterium]|nr:threonine/serine dehydratase [Alphaproteobacteria bacterium]